ncbi:hypothetical protein PRUB_a1860 [Pseudoalteromonas rubra]|uniref:Uncharacterized protein n=1 Tax=Pseudoalteromonas rubra TaxID=43658 RepID=A0A8T0CDD6_9GAMM|nr:hypothetical protein PRUB_a1860 [Pseudoalteromonas rubra]
MVKTILISSFPYVFMNSSQYPVERKKQADKSPHPAWGLLAYLSE